jgi:hypothetical protein
MPDLAQNMEGFDLGYLQIVAELWGIEFHAAEFHQGVEYLVSKLLNPQLISEVVESLPAIAREAIGDILSNGGRITWALFTRRYGEVREMGPGRRDRASPHRDPSSPAEILWYRGIVGRAFFDTPAGAEEFAFIPADLRPLIPADKVTSERTLGRAALPAEYAHQVHASDRILADACTMLAALRMGLDGVEVYLSPYPGPYSLGSETLKAMLAAAGLLNEQGLPRPEPTRLFLESARGEALAQLGRDWRKSEQFNELALIPQLDLEGEWSNDPLRTRETILKFLASIPRQTWWHIESFVSAIRQQQPDFQRPAGDYDSWFIRHRESGKYLRGFEHWEEVDGQLLRFMLSGPLHWLGIVDLAAPGEGKALMAFRFSKWAQALLAGAAPEGLPGEDEKMYARSDARIKASTQVPRAVRYQVARFCRWEGFDGKDYTYQVTPGSLERAGEGGLGSNQLLMLLRVHADPVPPSLVKALERWDEHGGQARMEPALVLRVTSPDILQELRASRAARFLGDPLGPTAVIVKPGAREKVLAALAEMGYLGEIVQEK